MANSDQPPPKVPSRLVSAPKNRRLLWCDFPRDAQLPEFWKRRPVVVLSYRKTLHGAVTVAPCSTKAQPGNAWAFPLRTTIDGRAGWAICDKPTTVAVSRLLPDKGGIARMTGQHADADDLLQDTMLKCRAARHRFEAGTSLMAWARAVMRNSFLSGRRRARFQVDLPENALDRLFGVAESQSQAVEPGEVRRAVGELTSDHRDAVLLAGEGVSVEEAAVRLAIPIGTVKSRVARGRDRLRRIAEDGVKPPLPTLARTEHRPRKRRDWKGVIIR